MADAGTIAMTRSWRSGHFWLIFISAICLAGLSVHFAAIEVLRNRSSSQVLVLANDGRALVRQIDNEMVASGNIPPAADLTAAARQALRDTPLNAPALRLAGLASEMRGNSTLAVHQYKLAERVSRRDLRTQLALVEYAVKEGDVPLTLRHYDIALRTKAGVDTLLYPILRTALEGAPIQREFVKLAATSPPWIGDFLGKTIRAGGHAATVAAISDRMGGLTSIDRSRQLDTLLLQGLAADRRFDLLRQRYLAMPHADRSALTSSQFSTANMRSWLGPIAWQILPQGPLLATFTRGEAGGLLDLTLALDPGNRALVARKLLFLPPGPHRFQASIRPVAWLPESSARWELHCALTGDEPLIWGSDPLNADHPAVRTAVSVPGNCAAQYLDLIVTASATGQTALELIAQSPILAAGSSPAGKDPL